MLPKELIYIIAVGLSILFGAAFYLLVRNKSKMEGFVAGIRKGKYPQSLSELPQLSIHTRTQVNDFTTEESQIVSRDFDYSRAEKGFYRIVEQMKKNKV